jgi:DNA methylase
MTQLPLLAEGSPDLAAFFSNIHTATNKNPLTHGLHPYPAKFIPHIPRVLISALSAVGDVVCDPMCGSGTTLVEAAVSHRRSIGSDINPVGVLAARAKTVPLAREDTDAIEELLARLSDVGRKLKEHKFASQDLIAESELPRFHNREKWFGEHVVYELAYLRRLVRELRSGPARQLGLAIFSSIIVGVSNQESETRWCAKPRRVDPGEPAQLFAAKTVEALRRNASFQAVVPATSLVVRADARQLPLADGSVGLVVTSPPYANSHDYYLYNKLRLFWLGEDVTPVQQAEIGSRHRHSDLREDVDVYLTEMAEVMREVHRILGDGGHAALVVADAVIRKRVYEMDTLFAGIGKEVGLDLTEQFAFAHVPLNASFQRGFGTKSAKQTHVLVFEKS